VPSHGGATDLDSALLSMEFNFTIWDRYKTFHRSA
jgi:hypothetical protein